MEVVRDVDPATTLVVRALDDVEEPRLVHRWNELARRSETMAIWGSFTWWSALRHAHRQPGERIHVLVAERADELVAIWPLIESRRRVGRLVSLRRLADASDWYMPHNGLVRNPRADDAALAFLRYLVRSPIAWDYLDVRDLVEGAWTHRALTNACRELGLGLRPSAGKPGSPYVALDRSWADYVAERGSKFRSELKRVERAVDRLGRSEVIVLKSPEEVTSGFERVLEVERASWKHAAGTAISSRSWEERFYRRLCQTILGTDPFTTLKLTPPKCSVVSPFGSG